MNCTVLLLAVVTLSGPSPGRIAPVKTSIVVARDIIDVPAQEAGVLVGLNDEDDDELVEGTDVVKGALIARIDLSKSKVQLKAAQKEYESAKVQAENNAPIEAAKATTDVAKAEYENSREITKREPKAVSIFEMRRLKLTWERSLKQEKVAESEQEVAVKTMGVKQAAIEAAELDINRRHIKSPIDGEIIEVLKKSGEWVNPGDPVMKVLRMNRVRVQGTLSTDQYTPEQVANRAVRVRLHLPDRDVDFQGKVDFVNPIVLASDSFSVRAEIENRKENGFWVLRPGLSVEMSIELDNDSPVVNRK